MAGRMRDESGRGYGLRDEVDLIMKRLRIPWRGRVGSQVNWRVKRGGETDGEESKEREKERS